MRLASHNTFTYLTPELAWCAAELPIQVRLNNKHR